MNNQKTALRIEHNHKPLLFLLFFISGFSGLIYESIWTHYLKLFLGHSAYAQTLVLAIFMGGMAVGAWICSRLSARWMNLLVLYAAAEGLIGIAALLFHPLFIQVTDHAFTAVIPALESPLQVQIYKWGLAGLLVVPQSILLGMTFPLMSGGLIRLYPKNTGGSIALLYFTNSLGGAIGVLASGFVTIRLIGLDGTVILAGVINILLAMVVWKLFHRHQVSPSPVTGGTSQSKACAPLGLMLVVALLTGAASFIYEITWIRMLSMVLGSSTHAFELMLSAFIFGLAFGGLWIHRRIDHLPNSVAFLAKVQIIMGLAALATLPLYGQTFHLMQWFLGALKPNDNGFITFNLLSHTIAMLVMFPTAFCAGMTLPLITHSLIKQQVGERAIGAVYGSNTLGAILGIVIAVHIGLPLAGIKNTLLAGAFIDLGLGLFLIGYLRRRDEMKRPLRWLALAITPAITVAILVDLSPHKMASGVYRSGSMLPDEQLVLDFRDGKTATISLTAQAGVYSIRTNGKVDASINMDPKGRPQFDEVTMTLLAAIPLLTHPKAQTVANIGFGSGMTSNVLLASPHLTALDTIEIESAMVATAKAFRPFNEKVFSDPRSRIFIDDAKTYFSSKQKKYDLVVSEPSNPWVSGVSGLFSREFYHNIKRHLNERGVVAQWLQIYEFDMPLLASTLKAVAAEFEHFTVYAVDHANLLILASAKPIADIQGSRFSIPELGDELARIGVDSNQDLRARWIGDQRFLAPVIKAYDIQANSDYFPVVDQHAAKARFIGSTASDILFPTQEALPLRALLAGRELGNSRTHLNSSPMATLSIKPNQATYLYARLLDLPTSARQQPWKLTPYLDAADRLLNDCRNLPAHGDKVFLLYGVAAVVLPHLSSGELHQVWAAIEELSCGSSLNAYEARWLALFKAVSNRNTDEAIDLALALLRQPQYLTETRAKYLLGISMLCMLTNGQEGAARQLWNNFPLVAKTVLEASPELNYLWRRANYNN